jgi:glucose/arabinose dehydrogenase
MPTIMSKPLPRVLFGLVLTWHIAMANAGEPLLTSELVADGLADPLLVTHAPGDHNRIFIIERAGAVKILKDGLLLPTAFLDLTGQVHLMHERGLLGIAFHPDFASNKFFYVRYNNLSGQHTIARYTESAANPDIADISTAHVVWQFNNNAAHHNGGSIDFGPDGYLYITVGDDANPAHSQNITTQLHGKILRIGVDGDQFPTDATRNYTVPPDNPYVGIAGVDEIWAMGFRNPFRASFDRVTGDYWIADVGSASWEEIDFYPANAPGGKNFGWGCMEGAHCGGSACTCFDPSLTLPVHEYSHALGCSVTGGRVYRGCAIPQLQGAYFFADFCSNRIWSFRYVNGAVTELQERQSELDPPGSSAIANIVGFGEDAMGELYICDMSGSIYKIVPVDQPPDNNGNGIPDACEPPPQAGDITGDGVVNVDDLLSVIVNWGPCASPPRACPADIAPLDGDAVVNVDDLLMVIMNWG